MAENDTTGTPVGPAGPPGGPATPPTVLPWLVIHTMGRLGLFLLMAVLLRAVGLDFFSALLFGLLLSMPIAYFALRSSRERLSEALVARSMARRTQKQQLRDRLSGEQPPA